jgi:hypothetical protein
MINTQQLTQQPKRQPKRQPTTEDINKVLKSLKPDDIKGILLKIAYIQAKTINTTEYIKLHESIVKDNTTRESIEQFWKDINTSPKKNNNTPEILVDNIKQSFEKYINQFKKHYELPTNAIIYQDVRRVYENARNTPFKSNNKKEWRIPYPNTKGGKTKRNRKTKNKKRKTVNKLSKKHRFEKILDGGELSAAVLVSTGEMALLVAAGYNCYQENRNNTILGYMKCLGGKFIKYNGYALLCLILGLIYSVTFPMWLASVMLAVSGMDLGIIELTKLYFTPAGYLFNMIKKGTRPYEPLLKLFNNNNTDTKVNVKPNNLTDYKDIDPNHNGVILKYHEPT